MANLNMLSICVLIAAFATSDCSFSNLMNEPLNFAVSLLDGARWAKPPPPFPTSNAYPIQTPSESTHTITMPDRDEKTDSPKHIRGRGNSKYSHIIAKKRDHIRGTGSKNLPIVKAIRLESDDGSYSSKSVGSIAEGSGSYSMSSDREGSSEDVYLDAKSENSWKHVHAQPKRLASFSPSKKARNHRIVASFSNRGRSHTYSPSRDSHNHRVTASFSNDRGSSDYSHIHVRPVPPKGRAIKQSGWKKNTWAINRSGGSDEKFDRLRRITVKPEDRVGDSSEDVVFVKKTARPSWRVSKNRPSNRGYSQDADSLMQSKKKFSAGLRARELCRWCPRFSD